MEGIDPLAWIENFTSNKGYYHGWKEEDDDDDDDGSEVNEEILHDKESND